ncbi:hypothetical protein BS78_03G296400 [Paspalum vaginatum]|nr:hypothetical protein BS78_03G296400 [Paspalum vaginatum]
MTSLQLALLLAAAAGAASTALAAALALLFYRGSGGDSKCPPPELPLSLEPATKPGRRLALLLLTALCSGRCRRARARVEPAAAAAAAASSSSSHQQTDDEPPPSLAAEEAWPWRERCFGPASRALYTIYEEEPCDDAETEKEGQEEARREEQAEVETPYYTPPASPPPLHLHCSVASASVEDCASDTVDVCFITP